MKTKVLLFSLSLLFSSSLLCIAEPKEMAAPQKAQIRDEMFPVGEWVDAPDGSLHSRTPVKFMRLSDEAPDFNMTRWSKAYKNKDLAVFIDSQTVQKQPQRRLTNPVSGPPVTYLFWMKLMYYAGTNRLVTNAHQHFADCQTGTLDNFLPEPESSEEAVFGFFCRSRDALTTIPIPEPNVVSRQESELLHAQMVAAQSQREAAESSKTQGVMNGLTLMNGLSLITQQLRH